MAGRKLFFFEKKNQKTFVCKTLAFRQRLAQMARSFCFCCQKDALSGCR
jgi:hypothetical protein